MWPKLRGRCPPDELRAHLAVVARELSDMEWFPMIEAPSAFDRMPLREFEEIDDDETLRMIGKHLQLVMEARRVLARHTHPPVVRRSGPLWKKRSSRCQWLYGSRNPRVLETSVRAVDGAT
jgi:hypothetical protein